MPVNSAANLLLSLDSAGDRTTIQSMFSELDSFTFIEGKSPRDTDQDVDLWILDVQSLKRNSDIITEIKADQEPHYFPVLLLCPDDEVSALAPTVWEHIDDVIGLPTTPAVLNARIENLLRPRVMSERALTSQQRFESLVSTTSSAIIFLKPDGVITFVNDACTNLFGYDREELLNSPITRLIPPRLQESATKGLKEYQPRQGDGLTRDTLESTGQHKDGHEIPIQLSYGWFELDDQLYLTGIITETTAVKLRETRLQVLNRVLRHDIKNDMNVIMGYVSLLDDEFPEPNQYIQTILSTVDDVIKLSEQAAELDKLFDTDQKIKKRINITALIEEKCSEFENVYPNASVIRNFSVTEDIHVEAITLLESAIDNLLENAIEHNDAETPEVTVTITPPQELEHNVTEVEIADNGPGLPPEEVAVIETGTETSLEHASGLGLWLINWIVKESDGTVEFSERSPHGACITLRLPVA